LEAAEKRTAWRKNKLLKSSEGAAGADAPRI
jgi:hypothetical protein